MIGDLGLAVVFVIIIEACLGAHRDRRLREAKAQAYLNGVHAANRVHAAIGLQPTDARH